MTVITLFHTVLMASWPLFMAAQTPSPETVLNYTDQNNNQYILQNLMLEYRPVAPHQSSSGTYSGGMAAKTSIHADAALRIRSLSEAILAATAHHTNTRQKTTSVLRLMEGETTREVIISPCTERNALEHLLAELLHESSASMPQPVEIISGQMTSYTGNLDEGEPIGDLSWAWQSSVACFPEIRKEHFTGSHVFFSGVIPPRTEIIIRLIPDDPNANLSLYGYLTGVDNEVLPPDLIQCIRCEASHHLDRQVAGRPDRGNTRVLQQMLAIQRPYRVTIGVAGAQGLNSGGFTLEIDASPR